MRALVKPNKKGEVVLLAKKEGSQDAQSKEGSKGLLLLLKRVGGKNEWEGSASGKAGDGEQDDDESRGGALCERRLLVILVVVSTVGLEQKEFRKSN